MLTISEMRQQVNLSDMVTAETQIRKVQDYAQSFGRHVEGVVIPDMPDPT